jgi:hypothetical protein
MRPSQQAVVDSLNATLRSLQAARDSISTTIVGYDRIIAKHDELKTQLEALRDSYGKPRDDQPSESIKHPLVEAVEAIIPARPARHDFQRAYDQGIQAAARVLQRTIDAMGPPVPWITAQDGKLVISRCNFFYPQATENFAGRRDNVRFNLVDRMDGDIVLDFNGATLDAEHVARMLKYPLK